MRFIVDAALSPRLRDGLHKVGHDSVHLIDYDMLRASDDEVLARALDENRTVISADSDFATILAVSQASYPSLILFRHPVGIVETQVERVVACALEYEQSLNEGCIVVVARGLVRVRRLPLTKGEVD